MSDAENMPNEVKEPKLITKIQKAKKGRSDIKNGDIEVKVDGRSLTSKFNAFKHGKYSNLPMQCNLCDHRPVDLSGTGKCQYYQADSICVVDKDYRQLYEELDTRDTNQVGDAIGRLFKKMGSKLEYIEFRNSLEGGTPDRTFFHLAEMTLKYGNLLKELNRSEIQVKETSIQSDGKDIWAVIRQAHVNQPKQVSGDGEQNV